jgi:hypothetical protein
MKRNIPVKLYKYGSITKPEYLREILLDNKIYCSSPFDFNDPFDCRPRVVVGKTKQELKDAKKVIEGILHKRTNFDRNMRRVEAKRLIKKIQKSENLTDAYELLLSRAGVYCLSKKNDNLLIWAHYSDKHKGYCLEFSTEPEGSFFSNAEEVRYKRNHPIVKMFTEDKLEWGKESFLTKSTDWSYEEEWRLTSKKPGHIDFPPETLVGLILGCRMQDTEQQQILAWNARRHPPVKIYQAVMHEREFKLNIHDV